MAERVHRRGYVFIPQESTRPLIIQPIELTLTTQSRGKFWLGLVDFKTSPAKCGCVLFNAGMLMGQLRFSLFIQGEADFMSCCSRIL
jgi:hypothetical protein